MAVEWDSFLSLGVEAIDHQHQEIIRRINLFMAAVKDGTGLQEVSGFMDFLADYIISHFRAEEELMIRSNYPSRGTHQQEHASLCEKVRQIQEQVAGQGATRGIMVQTGHTMVGWLVKHILNTDKELARYLRTLPAAPAG